MRIQIIEGKEYKIYLFKELDKKVQNYLIHSLDTYSWGAERLDTFLNTAEYTAEGGCVNPMVNLALHSDPF